MPIGCGKERPLPIRVFNEISLQYLRLLLAPIRIPNLCKSDGERNKNTVLPATKIGNGNADRKILDEIALTN